MAEINENVVEEIKESCQNHIAEAMENINVIDSEEEPSKGKGKLIGLAVAGVAAVAVGAVALFRKHKKSKAEYLDDENFEEDDYVDEEIDEDFDQADVATEEAAEESEN